MASMKLTVGPHDTRDDFTEAVIEANALPAIAAQIVAGPDHLKFVAVGLLANLCGSEECTNAVIAAGTVL